MNLIWAHSGFLLALFAASPALGTSEPGAAAGGCPRFVAGSQGLPTSIEWRTHPALGDVNGDGHLDVAGLPRKGPGPSVWLGDGGGSWTPASRGLAVPGFSCGVGVDFGDVNGDGHLDLAVADHCNGLFVFLGDGTGIWKLGPRPIPGGRIGFEDVQLADLDTDGDLDLVAISSDREGIRAFLGDGAGNWAPSELGLPQGGYGTDLKLADINRDGRPDIAAAYSWGNEARAVPAELARNVVWLSNGNGHYVGSSPGLPTKGQSLGVALGDLNRDGLPDLAMSRDSWPGEPPLLVYVGDGGKTWTPALDGLPEHDGGLRFAGVEIADLNADGNADLVAVQHSNGAGIRIWTGDGAGHWTECTDLGLERDRGEVVGWGVAVADVNHDGKPDVAAGFGRNGAGSLEVWLQQ